MNRLKQTVLLTAALLLMLLTGLDTMAADNGQYSTAPTTHHGQRWRIGYYEGGEYAPYQQEFIASVRALMALGWLESTEIPPQQGEQTRQLWNWLASEVHSDYIEFVKDAHYSAGWDDSLRRSTSRRLIARLNQQKDLDLIIAVGTWAGQDLANDRHHTPTLVLAASDPLSAGIIKSIDDSGFEYVHATVDPTFHERQIQVFHEIVGFKRLGVAFENTLSGRSYAAMGAVEKLANERGFEIVPCYTRSDISDIQVAEASVVSCFRQLVRKVDALYITTQGGVTQNSIPKLVKIANDAQIPTFSQLGAEEVEYGVLLSLSRAGYKYVGEFHAATMARIFNGAQPNQLGQRFEEPPKIALNLKTAKQIGFDTPLLLLGAADEIFREIATP